jgi:hypothetical protein
MLRTVVITIVTRWQAKVLTSGKFFSLVVGVARESRIRRHVKQVR